MLFIGVDVFVHLLFDTILCSFVVMFAFLCADCQWLLNVHFIVHSFDACTHLFTRFVINVIFLQACALHMLSGRNSVVSTGSLL